MSICPKDVFPGRTDFDPGGVPRFLPNVELTDGKRDSNPIYDRLVEAAVIHATHTDMPGDHPDVSAAVFDGP